MKALIVGSGEIKDYKDLEKLAKNHNYIVCADGGIHHILKIGMIADAVIGDLDSIDKEDLKIIKKENIQVEKFPTMKDKSDTELCVDYLIEKGFLTITLVGVTGTRLDHTLSNIHLLKKIYALGVKAHIVDDNNKIFYLEDKIYLNKKEAYFISIIPISEEGILVSLNGFLYPLKKEYLKFGSTRGISNKIIEKHGEILIHRGSALVIESKD